jgi:hypothetical protein
MTRLGSSTKMGNTLAFSGILNDNKQFNPGIYFVLDLIDDIFLLMNFKFCSNECCEL